VDYKVGPLVAGTVPLPVTQTAYNLDAVGNWDSKTTDAVTETRTHNAANEIEQTEVSGQVLAISHDHNGNLIQDANYDYTFDENNRLISVSSVPSVVATYSYDALGRRISKIVGPDVTVFYYDNARIVEERDGSDSVQATYTFGNYIDEVLTKDAGANRYFYHQNTLWSVHALTDAAGAVVERYTYDAYGTITVLDPSFLPLTSSPLAYFTFTGREFDGETDLYHYRARTYGPGLGRFYQRDVIGYDGGINLYEYVKSNPVVWMDPLGLARINSFRIVAKSFIQPIGPVPGIPPGFSWNISQWTMLWTATNLAFRENPWTDIRDGIYRLYSKQNLHVCCSNSQITWARITPLRTDVGSEPPRPLLGLIALQPPPMLTARAIGVGPNNIAVSWIGAGRPHALAEPAFQAVWPRTSKYIWHNVGCSVSCVGDNAVLSLHSFNGSAFPTHRLWVNNVPIITLPQGQYRALWEPHPINPQFVR
jgi:RHS repeat-associated protein